MDRSRHNTAGHGEQGDIITNWLVKMVLILAVIGLIAYEILSVAITNVALDDNAREVARTARDAYRGDQSLVNTTASAEEVAATHGVTVTAIAAEGDELVIDLEKRAPTLLLHRLGPMSDLATATTSRRIRWTP